MPANSGWRHEGQFPKIGNSLHVKPLVRSAAYLGSSHDALKPSVQPTAFVGVFMCGTA
jgi:hypothetical protein